MEIKPLFLSCWKFAKSDGAKTRLWEDLWISDTCLALQLPRLYAILNNQNITVKYAFTLGLTSLTIRRALTWVKLEEWKRMLALCKNTVLIEEEDRLTWLLSSSKTFFVKSCYLAMQVSESVPYKFIWKVKLPLRIKTFLWLILRKIILTRVVLLNSVGTCTKTCHFCGHDESTDHLLLRCP